MVTKSHRSPGCAGYFCNMVETHRHTRRKKRSRLAYEDWSSEIASTNLVKAVIKEKLGYQCIIKRLSVTDQYAAVSNGSQDAIVGSWLPLQNSYYEKHKGQFVDLGPNLEGARTGLVVPVVSSTWLQAQDGQHTEPYMKIDSIEEIKDHYDEFQGKIIGIESDSGMMTLMREKLMAAYGLEDFELDPGNRGLHDRRACTRHPEKKVDRCPGLDAPLEVRTLGPEVPRRSQKHLGGRKQDPYPGSKGVEGGHARCLQVFGQLQLETG